MEQKYLIDKDLDAGTLTIKEMAETDVSKFTVLHLESFPLDTVEAALAAGKEALVDMFRSNNFFPPEFSANTLAEGILSMFGEGAQDSLKIAFCDNDALESRKEEAQEALVTSEKELVEIDKLLEDDDDTVDSEPDAEV
ncbi:hypothetical protein DSLASN_38690 [Desulfoluna limicola]|uniref:Uncharacterized protein n=1 Tax=Desulfoluna limicola TaxID=2810562 RepID=A0ABM7PM82_9BACT|nr:hypothetical protein [Desulfoluna limicola]BCS98237.1 hypothetical protein DSLASN_38690 [Desulfoluna limicola]